MRAMIAVLLAAAAQAPAQPARDYTSFQSGSPYSPQLDIGSDMAMVYGTGPGFPERVKGWRDNGYTIGVMTGIAWGDYGDYYTAPGGEFRREEVQTTKNGKLLMHGNSTTVGYNVPTPEYVEYIKKRIEPAVDEGAVALFMEEPEFWARSGWSEAFKREWERFYGEPWQEPDSSVDAQYRASKLKYEMYFNALRGVFIHAKARAAEKGRSIECHVPTHSLINYAHWGIVSPESHLMDLPEMDGYIAQVWTGTSRTPTVFRGERRERTFESAFLEYGQMLAMVRPTGRKVWFLHDPIEDNPNYSWNNYKLNYECTLIASLLWPEVCRYEVMPWPDRIFQGTYPKVDMAGQSGDREGIPADYATQLLTAINALNDMDQKDTDFDAGTRGAGVIVSDTMMFQRAAPHPSDPNLGAFYGLAMPLVKAGLPVEPVQMENLPQPNTLASCRVLLLTYEGQKPLRREYHEALDRWVRGGGCLLFVDDGADPYNHVREWWNDQGKNDAKPFDDLAKMLGITDAARRAPEQVGKGWVRVLEAAPGDLQKEKDGADTVTGLVRELFEKLGEPLKTQHYFKLRRGPYIVASVMEESVSAEPVTIEGRLVDLFDPMLPVLGAKTLKPGERSLLYDLDHAAKAGVTAKVAAAATRVRGENWDGTALSFTTRGPQGTRARMRILLPGPPEKIETAPETPVERQWDAGSGTLWLDFDNAARDLNFVITPKK